MRRSTTVFGIVSIFIFLITITSCVLNQSIQDNAAEEYALNSEESDYSNDNWQDDLIFMYNQYDKVVYEIDCAYINPDLQLFYFNSPNSDVFAFYVNLPIGGFSNFELRSGAGNLIDYTQGTGGQYCRAGRNTGENKNYLYCDSVILLVEEVSDNGEIITTADIGIDSVWNYDKEAIREEDSNEYFRAYDGELVSTDCRIGIYK